MIKSESYNELPDRFDICGKLLPQQIVLTSKKISHGLAIRLYNYAFGVLCEAWFADAVTNWSPLVYTSKGNDKAVDRIYCVRWTNDKSGYVEVVGIFTRSGWPTLDHGLSIGHYG